MLTIGWKEWCSLKKLGIEKIKAKIDTGAKTSSLHAFNMREYTERGTPYLAFDVHPLQKDEKTVVHCACPLSDRRYVRTSCGHRELRNVIRTPLTLGGKTWEIELTLNNRDKMGFRMLLGREALSGKAVVNCREAFLLQTITFLL